MFKINSYLFAVAVGSCMLTASCTQESAGADVNKITAVSELTLEQKQAIEKEILALSAPFFKDIEKLDIDACMSYFENTPDFLAINPDGTAGDYNSLKKLNGEAFSQLASVKNTVKKEVVRVLSNAQVLYTFFIGQDIVLKTGEKLKHENEAGTMLFTKINGAWKATFYHESALAPVLVK